MERIPLTKEENSLVSTLLTLAAPRSSRSYSPPKNIPRFSTSRLLCALHPLPDRARESARQRRVRGTGTALHDYLRSGSLFNLGNALQNEAVEEGHRWVAGVGSSSLIVGEFHSHIGDAPPELSGKPLFGLRLSLECVPGKEERRLVSLLLYLLRIQRKLVVNKIGASIFLNSYEIELCGSRSCANIHVILALEVVSPYISPLPPVPSRQTLELRIRAGLGESNYSLRDLARTFGNLVGRGAGSLPSTSGIPDLSEALAIPAFPFSAEEREMLTQASNGGAAEMEDLARALGSYCDPHAVVLVMGSFRKVISTLVKREFYPS